MKNDKIFSWIERSSILQKAMKHFSFAKNMGKILAKIRVKTWGVSAGKRSAADVLKTLLKRVIQKSANTARDLIGNKIVNRITNVSKNLQQNR